MHENQWFLLSDGVEFWRTGSVGEESHFGRTYLREEGSCGRLRVVWCGGEQRGSVRAVRVGGEQIVFFMDGPDVAAAAELDDRGRRFAVVVGRREDDAIVALHEVAAGGRAGAGADLLHAGVEALLDLVLGQLRSLHHAWERGSLQLKLEVLKSALPLPMAQNYHLWFELIPNSRSLSPKQSATIAGIVLKLKNRKQTFSACQNIKNIKKNLLDSKVMMILVHSLQIDGFFPENSSQDTDSSELLRPLKVCPI